MSRDLLYEDDGINVRISGKCTVTGETYAVEVTAAQWDIWKGGVMIQDAMPNLSADQREFLISGSTPAEFQKLFGGELDE
jgi:hypothetical protein